MERIYDLYLPVAAAELEIDRIIDEEKLLHLHPHWFVKKTDQGDIGLSAVLRDHATDQVFSLKLRLDRSPVPAPDDPGDCRQIMRIFLFDYPVEELLFFADRKRSRVRVRFAADQVSDDEEQDILLWIRAIQEYLRLYIATTPRTLFFRLLMNKMILRMNPSQRKICLMLTKITIIELLIILILVLGYAYFIR
ncbi:hypothetical protein [Desulfolithobacter sp.]